MTYKTLIKLIILLFVFCVFFIGSENAKGYDPSGGGILCVGVMDCFNNCRPGGFCPDDQPGFNVWCRSTGGHCGEYSVSCASNIEECAYAPILPSCDYWTNDYQCNGTVIQRKYLDGNCNAGWYDWEYCTNQNGCYVYINGCEDRDYYCSSDGGGTGCLYTRNWQTDFYDAFVNYCSGTTVRKNQVLHDFYCGGSCLDHQSSANDQLVQDCGGPYWDAYCSGTISISVLHNRGCSGTSCFNNPVPYQTQCPTPPCTGWTVSGCSGNYIQETRTCYNPTCTGAGVCGSTPRTEYRNTTNCDSSDNCYAYGNGCESRDYYCLSGVCTYSASNRHTDYYDAFVNYCSGTTVRKNQVLHNFYCGGSCLDHTSTVNDQLVQNCPYCCSGNSCTGICASGTTSSQVCGNCGTQSRTCSAGCAWGAFGTCNGQGCAPGATQSQTQACGNCGSQSRTITCNASCVWPGWPTWGTCTGQGACAPSSTQSCGDCGRQTCTSGCAWDATCSCSTCNCNQYDTCVGTTYRDYSCSNGRCVYTDYPNDLRCNQAPSISLVAPPHNTWINTNPTFTGLVTDPNNDTVKAYFNILSLYDVWGTLVNSGQNSTWTYSVPNQGCFSSWWRAFARDEHNVDSGWTPGYWLAKVDKDNPTLAISYTTGIINYSTFTVSLTESDSCSGINQGDVDIRIKVPSPGWGSWQDYSSTINDFNYTGINGYQYMFRYRTMDNAGNWSNFAEGGVVEIKLNNPPTAAPSSEVFIYCVDSRHPVLHFTYSDSDGDVQNGYTIQVDNNSNFSSPEDNTGWHYTTSTQYLTSGDFGWNTTYYWRVKVKDSKGLESNWSITDNFITPKHGYPSPDFTYLPRTPIKEEEVTFTDNSSCFDDKPTTTECSPAYSDSFSWDLNVGGGSGVVPLTSILENPTAFYSNQGLWNVKLTVRDKDNYTCSITKPVRINYPLPKWREIKPD